MFEHLQYTGAVIKLKTPAGRQAGKILDLNDPDSVSYREFVLDLIAALEQDRRESIETIREIDRQIQAFPQRSEELRSEKVSADEELRRIEHNLARLTSGSRQT